METIAVENAWLATDNAIEVLWNVGKRCNFNCSYCNIELHDNFSSHLSLEVCKKTIDTLLSKTDKKLFISLTGGEPTVNPKFIEIIKYMKDKGVDHISLTTNGSRTKDFYLGILQYLDNIIFSYHMEYHNREKILDTILACNEEKKLYQCNVAAHIMMLPTMFEEAKEVMHILKEQDGIKITMRRIRPAFEVDNPINEYENGRLVKGVIARPFYGDRTSKTSILLFYKGKPNLGPDYSKGGDYYSEEELAFLKEYKV